MLEDPEQEKEWYPQEDLESGHLGDLEAAEDLEVVEDHHQLPLEGAGLGLEALPCLRPDTRELELQDSEAPRLAVDTELLEVKVDLEMDPALAPMDMKMVQTPDSEVVLILDSEVVQTLASEKNLSRSPTDTDPQLRILYS